MFVQSWPGHALHHAISVLGLSYLLWIQKGTRVNSISKGDSRHLSNKKLPLPLFRRTGELLGTLTSDLAFLKKQLVLRPDSASNQCFSFKRGYCCRINMSHGSER